MSSTNQNFFIFAVVAEYLVQQIFSVNIGFLEVISKRELAENE